MAAQERITIERGRWWSAVAPTGLIALGLALYLPGMHWGLPGTVSWSQDSIAGIRTLGAMETWPERWAGRYPPLHYMVLRAAYEPLLAHWRNSGQVRVDPVTGEWQFVPPHAPKVGRLLLIARLVSVAMGIGAGLVLMHAARRATGDVLAAVFASVAFMSGAAFTYFAHVGNADVPSVFWFALSLLFYVRVLSSRSALDAGALGLFAALTVCTKDGWIGIYPGMALVLLIAEWRRRRSELSAQLAQANSRRSALSTEEADGGRSSSALSALWSALLRWQWIAGAGAFILPYLVINGILWNPGAYWSRLGGWLSPAEGAWITREHRHDSVSLLIETTRQAAAAVGWPMLAALLAATIYVVIRRPWLAVVILAPIVSYYLIVIERIDFVYERFLFAPLMMLCVLLGCAAADWIRNVRLPRFIRLGVPALVLLPTVGYAAAIDLEMRNDSRYAAEQWFTSNVPREASVGAIAQNLRFFSPQYLPRLPDMGYATYPVVCSLAEFERPQPEYLVLSSFDHQDFDEQAMHCAGELLSGRLSYRVVATFESQYLGSGKSLLSLVGWGAPVPGKISPKLTVLHRGGD